MGDAACIKGFCQYMCPSKEIKWREEKGLLHPLELKSGTKADPEKVVKQFSRSAAGKAEPAPDDLRPPDVLLKTMNYLINNVIPTNELPFVDIYDFVNDRIQAIRQDITIQMLQDINTVEIYEKCVRFYIFSSYYLCEEPQYKFDQFLNKQQLCICLEKLLDLYQYFSSDFMSEFVSVYFTLNIDNYEKIYRHEALFVDFFNDKLVKMTLKSCIAWIDRNFIRFFRCVKKLPLTLQIMLFHQFGFMRRTALKVLSIAYSSTICQFPIAVLSQWLCLSVSETLLLCKNFNISIKNNFVMFHKKNYMDNKMPSLKKESMIERSLKCCAIHNLING